MGRPVLRLAFFCSYKVWIYQDNVLHLLKINETMAQLTGLKKLQKKIQALKDFAEQYREDVLQPKQDWLEDKSDKYKEGDAGQEWESHLYDIECVLDEIDNIDIDQHVE